MLPLAAARSGLESWCLIRLPKPTVGTIPGGASCFSDSEQRSSLLQLELFMILALDYFSSRVDCRLCVAGDGLVVGLIVAGFSKAGCGNLYSSFIGVVTCKCSESS